MSKWQVYTWVASGAGWCVIAYVADSVEAGIVAILCLGVAAIWNEFVD